MLNLARASIDARAFCLCRDANPTMSGKHVFFRFFAEFGNVPEEGELVVRGRWARSTLRIVDFPRISQGFRATVQR